MNILVTGSNGFIGSHVSTYLKENGHYVIGLDEKNYQRVWLMNIFAVICIQKRWKI